MNGVFEEIREIIDRQDMMIANLKNGTTKKSF